jgi:hypothetical protein
MNKLILYFVIVFFVGISCDKDEIGTGQADKFIKYYGGLAADHGNDVKQLPGGGYFIVGTIKVGDNTDGFVLITDKYGNSIIDLKTYGGPFNDKVSMMQLLPDGGAVTIGTYQRSLNNNDIWLMRFNNRGDTLWTQKFGKTGNDEGNGLLVNANNEIVCTGYITEQANNVSDKQIWIYARYLDGSVSWPKERIHGYNKEDEGNYIVEVEDGYVVVGTTNSIPSGTSSKNIALLKIDEYGIQGYMKAIGGNDDDYGRMVKVLPDGNIMVLGTTIKSTTNNSDIVIAKVDASLNVLSQPKVLDGGENETASCFLYKNNRLHILGTTTEPRTATKEILLIITNESGDNPEFLKYGFKDEIMEGFGMDYTSDGGFVFTGSNLVLFKIKDSGEL